MRRLDHQNVVQLLYFFFISSSDRVRVTHVFIYEVMTIQSFNFIFILVSSSSAEKKSICIWFWNLYRKLLTKWQDTMPNQSRQYQCFI
jgi:hypothetical protein